MVLKHFFFIVAALLLSVTATFGQEQTITGTVTDQEGIPLPGVNVVVKGTTRGTQTNFNGNYEILASEGEILVFSFLGMQKAEIKVQDVTIIDAVLKPDAAVLEEVIITAAGIQREKASLGSATTTVGSEELNEGSQANIADALKGKIAGVNINSASTDPGASSGVIIRGISSLSGSNQPLYVVDGVPINNGSASNHESATGAHLYQAYDFGRGSQDINPQNIESMTILKGASATSLYGSRAANGVVIITTKDGKEGKLAIDLSSSVFFSQISRTPKYQSTFGQGWDGLHYLIENGSWGPRFDGEIRAWGNIVDNSQQIKPFSFQEDQLENFFSTGTYYQNSVAISGGTETITARLSYSNLDQDGIFPTDADSFNRNNLGVNVQSDFGTLSMSGSLNYVKTAGAAVAAGQGITVLNNLMQIPTDLNISGFKDYNNKFNNVSNYYTPYGITNPYFTLNENGTDYQKERIYGSFEVGVEVSDWSNLTYRFGLDVYADNTKLWEAIVAPEPGSPNFDSSTEYPGSYSENMFIQRQYNHDLLYDVDLLISEALRLQTTTGFNINSQNSSFLTASVGSQNIPGFYSLSNSGEDPSASSLISEQILYGLFNTTTFSYKNTLFLTGNLRNDWYSTLPVKNRSVLYGGANASWIFTRSFEGINGFINYGKLRAGYGEVGVDTAPYNVFSVFVAGSTDNQGFRNLNFPLGGINGYEVGNRAENPDLKPERRKEYEVGVDLEFFSNRIGLDFTYYNATVENQIIALPLAPSSGFTSQQANLGEISNEGIEALLKVSWVRNPEGFGWNSSFNFTKNDSELVELDPRINQVSLGGLASVTLVAREGYPLALLEGPVPLMHEGNIVVDSDGIPIASPTPEIYGDTQYDYTLGISNEFSYKNLSLGFTLDIREGGLMYSRTADITRFTGNSITTTFNDRETFIVPNSVQRVIEDDGTTSYIENTTPVSRANFDNEYYGSAIFERQNVIEKSFVKLREVVLNYYLSKEFLKPIGLDALSFSVIGRNLFLWTPESNQFIDPEVSTFGTDLQGQFGEFSASPSTRSIGFSIKTRF